MKNSKHSQVQLLCNCTDVILSYLRTLCLQAHGFQTQIWIDTIDVLVVFHFGFPAPLPDNSPQAFVAFIFLILAEVNVVLKYSLQKQEDLNLDFQCIHRTLALW